MEACASLQAARRVHPRQLKTTVCRRLRKKHDDDGGANEQRGRKISAGARRASTNRKMTQAISEYSRALALADSSDAGSALPNANIMRA